jgi:hypothetical protein
MWAYSGKPRLAVHIPNVTSRLNEFRLNLVWDNLLYNLLGEVRFGPCLITAYRHVFGTVVCDWHGCETWPDLKSQNGIEIQYPCSILDLGNGGGGEAGGRDFSLRHCVQIDPRTHSVSSLLAPGQSFWSEPTAQFHLVPVVHKSHGLVLRHRDNFTF